MSDVSDTEQHPNGHNEPHVSIGDVLNQLSDDFPDVTISKIRFLESQGLLVPERTPSGYRKFYAADVERLRWILRQQKEHFLPLKVIKERLEELDRTGGGLPEGSADVPAPAPAARTGGGRRARSAKTTAATGASEVGADAVADDGAMEDVADSATGVSLTRTELARAAELSDDELVQLEEYGLVIPAHRSRDRVLFDDDALVIARIASKFMRHGVEARHLRMYRAFAEREAGLFEQVLLPYRRQRNPEAQARTRETLGELSGLGRQLRTALLRQTVRRSLMG